MTHASKETSEQNRRQGGQAKERVFQGRLRVVWRASSRLLMRRWRRGACRGGACREIDSERGSSCVSCGLFDCGGEKDKYFRFQISARVEKSKEETKSKGMVDRSCRCRKTERVDVSMELCSYIDEGHDIRRSRYATRSLHE